MKIISKYKDYYDYLVGAKFGIDNKIVLDRREGFVIDTDIGYPKRYKQVTLAICGKVYIGVMDSEGKIYWGDDRLALCSPDFYSRRISGGFINTRLIESTKDNDVIYVHEPRDTELNTKHNCPILYARYDSFHVSNIKKFPKLGNLNLAGYICAEDMYMLLYNWISRGLEEVHVATRTDTEKLQSKGFDKKKSFRHRKK